MNSLRLLKHGLVGLVVTVVVGLVPGVNVLAPLVGGAAAGYLHREALRGGAVAGAVVGLLWTVLTLLLVVVAVVGAAVTAPVGVGPFDWLPAAGGGLFVAVLFVGTNAVVVAAATLGGAVGGALARDADEGSAAGRAGS